MFTGIVENTGTIRAINGNNGASFVIETPWAGELKTGESVAVDGVCLTVISFDHETFTVFASKETIAITNLKQKSVRSPVNLERAMLMGGRLDGHMVYGHADETASLIRIARGDKSSILTFSLPEKNAKYVIQKGSISINGISLTVYDKRKGEFDVMIIPHTFEVTNLGSLVPGSLVNLEYDVVAKYIENMLVR